MEQLEFKLFEETTEDRLREEIDKIRASSEKVRRKLFVKQNELARLCSDIDSRLAIIEKHLCHTSLQHQPSELCLSLDRIPK